MMNSDAEHIAASGDMSLPNSSLELLEQHQAREQARLLQRFHELRQWQQQQQQQLMQQQEQQLHTWQSEQSKVQTLIAKQGGKAIKPNTVSSRSPLMTPPTKPRRDQVNNLVAESTSQLQMAGVSLDSGLVVSMQDTLKSQSSLPKPVMYPSLASTLNKGDDNDEDKYTNSELFSNLGSHDDLQERVREALDEEDTKPCPDGMSDSSENFLKGSQLPPVLPIRGGNQLAGLEQLLKTAPAGLLQQMLGLLPGGTRGPSQVGRGSEDVELSASPTFPAPGTQQQQPAACRMLSYQSSSGSPKLVDDGGGSPVLDGQQQQSKHFTQHQQQMLSNLQQSHHQQKQQIQQQQIQSKKMGNGIPHAADPSNSHLYLDYQLGPPLSEPDVDPYFVPRTITLRDFDLRQQTSQVNGHQRHEEEEEEEDGIGYDEEEDPEYEEDDNEEEYNAESPKCTREEDRPIKGTGGRKTFEQLLEEQLQKEKEKSFASRQHWQQQQSTNNSGMQHKVSFLKKGEGTARFNSAPKKPPPKRKSAPRPHVRPYHPSDMSDSGGGGGGEASKVRAMEDGGRKPSVGSRLKNMAKPPDGGGNTRLDRKGPVQKGSANQPNEEGRPVAKLSLIRSAANRKMEEQHRQMQQEQQNYQQQEQQKLQQQRLQEQQQLQTQQKAQDSRDQPFFRGDGARRFGDLSTIIEQSPSLDEGSTITEDHDSTELDSLAEFEALEEAADNLSLCSSSSVVGRLLYGDKQGQKEAVQKLKTITESLKSARSEGSGSDLKAMGSWTESTSNANNNNNNNQVNEMGPTAGIGNAGETMRNDTAVGKEDQESLDVTLTDSSDDENADSRLNFANGGHIHYSNTKESSRRLDYSSGETNPAPATSLTNQVSPTKTLTRKVAPLSSKFSAASDTLSLLKSLSVQANLLTSNAPDSSTTSAQAKPISSSSTSVSNSIHPPAPQDFNFFSNTNTRTPDFFSSSSRDGMLVTSAFGPSITQTFPSSSVIAPVPVSSSSGINNFLQFPKASDSETQPSMLNLNKHEAHKTSNKKSDEDTNSDDDDDNDESCSENDSEESEDDAEKNKPKEEKEKVGQDEEKAMTKGGSSAFDDESAWEDEDNEDAFDSATSLKVGTASRPKANDNSSTPPTSRLMTKLFPKLKPKPSMEAQKNQQSLREASAQPVDSSAGGVQSSILREKLKELDVEIEKFRSENSNLEKLRREREEGLSKLKQEIENFQREKESELRRLEEFKAEELKKLKREKKLFDSYQKKLRSMPDKKEREEIENLKTQLQETQDELKHKESRWTASTARLKNKMAELELENGELKEEVRILERKRLEWMTSQGGGAGRGQTVANGKAGGPTSLGGGSTVRTSEQPGPRSSTPTGESGQHAQQADTVQVKDGGKQGPSSGSSNYNNKNASSYNKTNNNRNNKISKPTTTANNNSNGTNSQMSAGGKAGGVNSHANHSTVLPQRVQKGAPASTASLVAPTVPITALAAPPHQQQQQLGQTTKEGGDGVQTMQKTTVPVMMECTIPAGTEVSRMPGLQPDMSDQPPSPEKSAARLAMERAVVDKGDPTVFTENRHQDGKLEKTFRTGAKEIHFPNGTVKEISADGQTIVCRLANGDIRQIFPDHRVVYIFSGAQIMQTTFPDGLETFQFQNGQVERRYPDGTVEITFPSKDIKYLFPDGGQEVILTDGTVMQYNSSGERTVEYPSGDREVHTAEFQRREFPDGIIKTIYADGRHETRFPNGRVRIRDKDGNVVMDQIIYR